MTASASLDATEVTLAPGEEISIPLLLRNTSDIVDAYSFEVLGDCAAWATVEPETVSLYPGSLGTVELKLSPPRSADVPVGEVPFAVRVQSAEFPEHAVIPEGVLWLQPFHDTSSELLPQTSHGRLSARHQVAIDNRGNLPVTMDLSGKDSAERLRYAFRPETVTVGPGRAAFARLVVRPTRVLWRGSPVTHPFQVTLSPDEGEPIVVDGTYLQEPLLPKWTLKALLLALALLAALAAVWFGLLRPAVKAAAQDAVSSDVQPLRADAAAAKQQAAAANDKAAAALGNGGKGGGGQGSQPSGPPVVREAFSMRLPVSAAAPDEQKSAAYTVPEKKTLHLTDMVLENPQGDAGTITVKNKDQPLLTLALENFRDQDYHWVTPIDVHGKDDISVTITCKQVGKPVNQQPKTCAEAMYLDGVMDGPAS